jgi:hypothetical protein
MKHRRCGMKKYNNIYAAKSFLDSMGYDLDDSQIIEIIESVTNLEFDDVEDLRGFVESQLEALQTP